MKQRVLSRGLPRDLRATTYLLGFVVSTVLTILIVRLALVLSGYPQVGGHGLHIDHDVNNVVSIGGTITSTLAAFCVVWGLRKLRSDRRSAYGWFERAVLIDLLLTQVFQVTSDQFGALPGIVIDLIMLAVLGAARSQITQEGQPPVNALVAVPVATR